MLHVLLKVVQMVNDRTETAASVLERSVLGINSNLFSMGRMKHSMSPRHTKGMLQVSRLEKCVNTHTHTPHTHSSVFLHSLPHPLLA